MNATPTGGNAREESGDPDPDRSLPAPRTGSDPLPRRARSEPAASSPSGREPSRNPDGRPIHPVDDAVLDRLLSGLRNI